MKAASFDTNLIQVYWYIRLLMSFINQVIKFKKKIQLYYICKECFFSVDAETAMSVHVSALRTGNGVVAQSMWSRM